MLRPRTSISLAVLALLTACATTSTSAPFPVESRTFDVAGAHFTIPAGAGVEQHVSYAPVTAGGRFHGAVKLDGTLRTYNVRYAVYMTGQLYQPRMVIEVPKGSCATTANQGCVPFVNERTEVGGTTVITQRWPDDEQGVLAMRIVQNGARIVTVAWSEAPGATDTLAQAIAERVVVDAPLPSELPSTAAPMDPISVVPAPSSVAAPSAAPSSAR